MMKDIIYLKISAKLHPQKLEVIDESHLHIGHAGYKSGGETHFLINIFDSNLSKQPRIQMHRAINKIMEDELKNQIHALSIKIHESESVI